MKRCDLAFSWYISATEMAVEQLIVKANINFGQKVHHLSILSHCGA